MESGADVIIGEGSNRSRMIRRMPNLLKLKREVRFDDFCCAVTHFKGVTYVETHPAFYTKNSGSSIRKIDAKCKQSENIASLERRVVGLTAFKNKLYVMKHDKPSIMHVYSVDGELLCEWNIDDDTNWTINSITTVGDHLIIASKTQACLHVYTFAGVKVYSVPCEFITDTFVSLCGCGGDAVLIANKKTDKIIKLNLATGEIEWTLDEIVDPVGVCLYSSYHSLVTSSNQKDQVKVSIIDTSSGKLTFS